MSFVSAHVLDSVHGCPARGVDVTLLTGDGHELATATTDEDGRVGDLGPETLESGHYRIVFATEAYFAGRELETFYPFVSVDFTVRQEQGHYHVPLLLSPFAYSTYRGS
ncbi:hydroxyisourate hydrolase [Kocuria tytonis]|uniref:5-hydroxyisourate hydrolase n=1 Tax=Kocuria tytonis TaxID=2054280 RepID=A0A495A314_9MICC|nr:hydroxyisourate hydrolase [Kocuria tytonis]RKQ33714.1 hydroxyisourate hydrolase [Kocuria tytonis]